MPRAGGYNGAVISGKPLPRPLAPGEVVGVWAPASAPRWDKVERGVELLRRAGFKVEVAPNVGQRRGYLAGDDAERLAGLSGLLARGVRALWAARGGYGVMRLLPQLPWEQLARWGGWLVGYSDLTALHCAALLRLPVATLHGPMVTGLGSSPAATERVLGFLQGQLPQPLFRFSPKAVLRKGRVRGVLLGGNLSLLAALVGTPYEPPWEGAILALEDVAEPGYRLDRLLTQLSLAGRLQEVAGVVVGRLARCGRGEPGFRQAFAGRLLELFPSCPVVFGLDFGHVRRNLAFPVGCTVLLDCEQGVVGLEASYDQG